MSADLLRRAAEAMRANCPIPEKARAMDFIDYPTGWALQRANEVAHDERCSATQTSGAMLCDCEALLPMWVRWRTLLAVADWLDREFSEWGDIPHMVTPHALAVARAYLGEAS